MTLIGSGKNTLDNIGQPFVVRNRGSRPRVNTPANYVPGRPLETGIDARMKTRGKVGRRVVVGPPQAVAAWDVANLDCGQPTALLCV